MDEIEDFNEEFNENREETPRRVYKRNRRRVWILIIGVIIGILIIIGIILAIVLTRPKSPQAEITRPGKTFLTIAFYNSNHTFINTKNYGLEKNKKVYY
jgi:hypothetical protein